MAKGKKKEKKQKIKVYFRDGKKDIIPQKYWDDYEILSNNREIFLTIINDGQRIAGYNMKDVSAYTVG